VEEAVPGILTGEHVVQRLDIDQDIRGTERQKADVPWCDGVDRCSGAEMKWCDGHSPNRPPVSEDVVAILLAVLRFGSGVGA